MIRSSSGANCSIRFAPSTMAFLLRQIPWPGSSRPPHDFTPVALKTWMPTGLRFFLPNWPGPVARGPPPPPRGGGGGGGGGAQSRSKPGHQRGECTVRRKVMAIHEAGLILRPQPLREDKAMPARSFDVVILGGGNAGMGVTVATREAGLKFAVIEPDLFGGTCARRDRARPGASHRGRQAEARLGGSD